MASLSVVVLVVVGVVAWLGSGGSSRHSTKLGQPSPTRPASGVAGAGSTTTTVSDHVAVAAPFVSGETAAWVQGENAKPGTRDWILSKPATAHQIEGYTNTVSVDQGGTVALFVSTTSASYSVQSFRMGWYGGDKGRLVWSEANLPGVRQPACGNTPATHTTSCAWQNPLTVATTGWPQGDYLFKLQSADGWQSYVPLTIRDDRSRSAFLVNNSVTTWEAYNTYGGYDLYKGPNGALATRASAVSFDRPDDLGNGGGDFVGLELPLVSMMESHDLDVSYTTDVDLSENPALVGRHKTFISLGHDEYYSLAMFEGLASARDAGVNLVFLGANAVYRHIRLEPSTLGPSRVEVDYKNPAADPLHGKNNADTTPWAWRDPPNNAPESALLGEMWQCNPVRGDMVVTDAANWMFAGSGLINGSHIPGIVGPEFDHFSAAQPNPGDVTVVARSPVNCNGASDEADMTYYSAKSGAGVWDTGTIDWVGSVVGTCVTCAPPNSVTWITDNVLAAFGVGPAGGAHPSSPNLGGAPSGPVPTSSVPASPAGD